MLPLLIHQVWVLTAFIAVRSVHTLPIRPIPAVNTIPPRSLYILDVPRIFQDRIPIAEFCSEATCPFPTHTVLIRVIRDEVLARLSADITAVVLPESRTGHYASRIVMLIASSVNV